MSQIVGICGRKGSGKTATAVFLNRRFAFSALNFADDVKDVCADLFGLDEHHLRGTQKQKETIHPRLGKTPREIMQHVGHSMRQIDDEVWINRVLVTAKELVEGDESVTIGDVRYANEAEAIRRAKGIVLLIVRPGVVLDQFGDHPSETGVDEIERLGLYTHRIVNDGTLDELYIKVVDALGYAAGS